MSRDSSPASYSEGLNMLNQKTKNSVLTIAIATGHILMFALIFNNWLNSTDTIVLANELPTVTVTPAVTLKPSPTPGQVKETGSVGGLETNITVKVSWYNPELAGVNCAHFKDGKCVSKLANGEPWERYIDSKNTIACPKDLKLGTKIKVLGRVWTCRDRGGKITKTDSGSYWIDMLTRDTVVAYGTEVEAKIIQ